MSQSKEAALQKALSDMVAQVERDVAMGLGTITPGCIENALDALEPANSPEESSEGKKAFEKIERMFTSLNSVETERAVIRKEDWDSAKQYLMGGRAKSGTDTDVGTMGQHRKPVAEVVPDSQGGPVLQWAPPYDRAPVGSKLYTHATAALEDWTFTRESDGSIAIDAKDLGFYVSRMSSERISEIILYALATDLLD